MKYILILILAAAPSLAGTYTATKTTALTNAAETLTIHLPSTATSSVKFDGVSIYSSAACTFTIERDGTAPATTASTVVKLNSTDSTNQALAYHTSNVGSGTNIGTHYAAAGSTAALDYRDKGLLKGENFSVKTTGCTATVTIIIKWYE